LVPGFPPFDAARSDFAAGLALPPDLPSPPLADLADSVDGAEPLDSLRDDPADPAAAADVVDAVLEPESDAAPADPPASTEAFASLRLSVR